MVWRNPAEKYHMFLCGTQTISRMWYFSVGFHHTICVILWITNHWCQQPAVNIRNYRPIIQASRPRRVNYPLLTSDKRMGLNIWWFGHVTRTRWNSTPLKALPFNSTEAAKRKAHWRRISIITDSKHDISCCPHSNLDRETHSNLALKRACRKAERKKAGRNEWIFDDK